MDPSKDTNPEPVRSKPVKWCWFAPWTTQAGTSRPGNAFGAAAQSALDAAESESNPVGGEDGFYRAGLTLDQLKPGECGTVRRLFGPAQGRLRLLEMGLTPGTHIKVVRAAAFGGPLDILVRGYQLSLRREEASGVWLDDSDEEKALSLADRLSAEPATEQRAAEEV